MEEALRRLAHRGPDGKGIHAEDDAVLGMTRLAIIDVRHGSQPIHNEDRTVTAVCNGELYNYIEAFDELRARNHRLQSGSDVNLIPHYYEECGTDTFTRLRGMFAAALWDAPNRRLVLARDRVGKKPLFYARLNGSLAFASELPALLALLDYSPRHRPRAIADYLRLGFIPHPDTIYEGVHSLPPGSVAVWEGGELSVSRYWRLERHAAFSGTRRDAMDELARLLDEAVRLRLRSDVPVGLFLSGGIDSGLVAAAASEQGAGDLLCFVVSVADATLDEGPAAHATAQHLGLPVEMIPLSFAPLDAVQEVPLLYGQPFGDSSAIPSYFVAQAAARHRKVVLNGDGGDEIFAGYRRYWAARLAGGVSLPRPLGAAVGAAGRLLARTGGRRSRSGFAARMLRGLGTDAEERYLTWTGDLLGGADLRRCFPGLARDGSTPERLTRTGGHSISTAGVRAFQQSDYELILPDGLLVKMDIATMAHSLEARSPLLDIPLAEFAWSLPESWMLNVRETKPLLRSLARTRLPPQVAQAPKRGFEVPIARWLATDLAELVGDLLISPGARVSEWADPDALTRFVAGKDGFAGNRAQAVWCLLVLELFLRAPQPAPARS